MLSCAILSPIQRSSLILINNSSTFPKFFKSCSCQGLSKKVFVIPWKRNHFLSSFKSFATNKSWSYQKESIKWRLLNQEKEAVIKKIVRTNCSKVPLANPLKVNINVKNNVMLYRFEKPVMYKAAAIFSVIALIACLAMADTVYLILCKDLWNPEKDLLTRLKAHILPLICVGIGITAGPAIMWTVWYVTVRTVKYIILRKGGQDITLITYHPIKSESKMTVPLSQVTCTAARHEPKAYVPIKLKNKKHHYIIDKQGFFVNPEIFDCTVGVKRW